MDNAYLTIKTRTEMIRELKNLIDCLKSNTAYNFSVLSDDELQSTVEQVKKSVDLLDGFKEVQKREGTSRMHDLNLLKRLATIFKYQDVDLNNLENLTDGQVWMHLAKVKTIQNHKIIYGKY